MFWFCLCHFIFPLFFLATYVGSEFATIGCLLSLLLSTAPAQPLWCNCLSSIRLRSSSCKRLPQHGGMYGVSSFLVFFLSSFLPFSFYNLGNVSFFLIAFLFPRSVVFATEMVISYYRYSDKSATEKKICQFGGLLHGRQYTQWQQFTPRHEPGAY